MNISTNTSSVKEFNSLHRPRKQWPFRRHRGNCIRASKVRSTFHQRYHNSSAARVLWAERHEIRQNIVIAITAEHWAEGKTGLAYFPSETILSPEESAEEPTLLAFEILPIGRRRGIPPTMTNGLAIFALLESPWSIPGHRRRCRSANIARIQVHREEKSPRGVVHSACSTSTIMCHTSQ